MKRTLYILLGFILGATLSQVHGVKAQSHSIEHDLTVKEIVEILAEYDLKHAEQQPFSQPAYGMTTFETNPPAIWIFNVADLRSRRSTVLHELIHVHYRNNLVDPPEEIIRAEEDRQYSKLFGEIQ